jgi:CBS domain-containing protein
MKVRDLMSYPIATVPPETTVLEAIKLMANGKKGCVLVAKDGLLKECKGILTMSRIFSQVFAEGRDPSRLSVVEVMTPAPLITIGLNASTKEAAALMIKHKIRRLPVIENGALVGIVTSKDLLRCVE